MALVTITINDIQGIEFQGILDALDLGSQEDTIKSVCDEVAGRVNANPCNSKVPVGLSKVPQELKQVTLVLIRQSFLGNSPNSADLEGSVRSTQYRDARTTLDRVAEGKFYIAPFEGDDTSNTYSSSWRLEDFRHI